VRSDFNTTTNQNTETKKTRMKLIKLLNALTLLLTISMAHIALSGIMGEPAAHYDNIVMPELAPAKHAAKDWPLDAGIYRQFDLIPDQHQTFSF
jgi:hypothetical protein